MPRSRTPAGSTCLALVDTPMLSSRSSYSVDSHGFLSFGAQSRSLRTRCLRFAVAVARTPRKTRYRVAANLPGPDFHRLDLFRRFQLRREFPAGAGSLVRLAVLRSA